MHRRHVPWFARVAKRLTTRRPYTCRSCGWHGWRTPLLDPSDHVSAQSELLAQAAPIHPPARLEMSSKPRMLSRALQEIHRLPHEAASRIRRAHLQRPELSRSDVIRWSGFFALGLVVGAFVVWSVSDSALETSSGAGTPVTASGATQPSPPTLPHSAESSEARGTIGQLSNAGPSRRSEPPGAQRRRVPPASSRVVTSTIERRSTARNRPAAEQSEDVARASATGSSARSLGTLTVNSVPQGARVSLDGRASGSTPLVMKDVPAGTHLVRLEADGYQVWAWTARVVANQPNTVTIKLVAAPIDSR